MAHTFVSELKYGQQCNGIYLVRSKDLRTTRRGSMFMTLEVGDKTGFIRAKLWDATNDKYASLAGSDFVHLRGRVELYEGTLELKLDDVRPAEEGQADLENYLPATECNVDELMERLRSIAKGVANPHLATLLESFLGDEEFVAKLKRAPAAVRYHHAFLGGLLEHTVSVAEVGRLVCGHYPEIDKDLLITGTIIHDLGKIEEMTYERTIDYTDVGRLEGHLIICTRMIDERARHIADFPAELLMQLRHLVLSHHGEYEWGSPKLPMTLEAQVLHYLDNLDAKINHFVRFLRELPPEENWTRWSKMIERKLYRGSFGGEQHDV